MVKDAYERLAANFGGAVTLDVIQRVSSKSRLAHARGMSDTSPVVLHDFFSLWQGTVLLIIEGFDEEDWFE